MDIYSKKLPTVKQLQYFVAVCEERSFRGAAEKLGVSQPPLSVQIKELEEKLDVMLFLRNSHSVVLTTEGEALKLRVTRLLNELCTITHAIKTKDVAKPVFGTTKTLSFDFIPSIKLFFSNFGEQIEIYKHNYTSKELLLELQKENIDFALVSDYPMRNQNDNSLLIHREPLLLVLPESHPCSQQEKVDLNDVTDLPLFWFRSYLNPVFYQQCEHVFKTLNFPLIRRAELPDSLSMLLEVSLGKGMMLLPQSMAQAKVTGVVYKQLIRNQDRKLSIPVYLMWRKNLPKNSLNDVIITYFQDTLCDV